MKNGLFKSIYDYKGAKSKNKFTKKVLLYFKRYIACNTHSIINYSLCEILELFLLFVEIIILKFNFTINRFVYLQFCYAIFFNGQNNYQNDVSNETLKHFSPFECA